MCIYICICLSISTSISISATNIGVHVSFQISVFVFFGYLPRSGIAGSSVSSIFSFFKKIYLFLAALGLHCCVRAFCSCGEQGLLFAVVRSLLIAVASLVVEHRL